jgi:tRNA (guanosine-2'-O-)-methyltransferase
MEDQSNQEEEMLTPERLERIRGVLQKRQPDLTVIFEDVNDPHNISAVLRTCDSVGIYEVFIITTFESKPRRLGVKSSASAKKWIKANYFTSVEECFKEVRKRYNKIYSTRLTEQSASLYDLNLVESCALVFGNEHSGVSELASSLSDGNFLILQVGMTQSLNISVACAVTLYEAFRQRMAAGKYEQTGFTKHQFDELYKEWTEK